MLANGCCWSYTPKFVKRVRRWSLHPNGWTVHIGCGHNSLMMTNKWKSKNCDNNGNRRPNNKRNIYTNIRNDFSRLNVYISISSMELNWIISLGIELKWRSLFLMKQAHTHTIRTLKCCVNIYKLFFCLPCDYFLFVWIVICRLFSAEDYRNIIAFEYNQKR